jgi:hypothetical protein
MAEWLKAHAWKAKNALFTVPHASSSLINIEDSDFAVRTNPQKSAQKTQTVSDCSIRFFPVRVHVFVISLAGLKAKPVVNHENAHPMQDWSCQLCNRHCAMLPFAEPVSNPTPPGQISHERASLVDDQPSREFGLREVCKPLGLICETDCAAYPLVRQHRHRRS